MTVHKTISQLANQCVLCGLCIPYCPTYKLFKTENESPRGRISLFKALAEEQVSLSDGLIQSLDHCLSCRACEKVCPSQVDYAAISRLGNELVTEKRLQEKSFLRQPLLQKISEMLLLNQSLHSFLKVAASLSTPVQKILGEKLQGSTIGFFSSEIAADAVNKSPLKNYYPVSGQASKGQVLLFKGCSGDLFEQQNLADSIRLINACRYNVIIPEKQQCCGAIQLRHGKMNEVKSQVEQNINSFTTVSDKNTTIVSLSNSCSGHLKEYTQFTSITGATELADKVSDSIAFLHKALSSGRLKFAPLHQEIAVHIPCSLKNVLREEQLLFELLAYIPGIRLTKLNDQFCCGAAGSYMLQFPEVANRLLDDKIEHVMQKNCNIVVSSNIGCTLHFKQGLKKSGHNTLEVIHPVRLLARQLIE